MSLHLVIMASKSLFLRLIIRISMDPQLSLKGRKEKKKSASNNSWPLIFGWWIELEYIAGFSSKLLSLKNCPFFFIQRVSIFLTCSTQTQKRKNACVYFNLWSSILNGDMEAPIYRSLHRCWTPQRIIQKLQLFINSRI